LFLSPLLVALFSGPVQAASEPVEQRNQGRCVTPVVGKELSSVPGVSIIREPEPEQANRKDKKGGGVRQGFALLEGSCDCSELNVLGIRKATLSASGRPLGGVLVSATGIDPLAVIGCEKLPEGLYAVQVTA